MVFLKKQKSPNLTFPIIVHTNLILCLCTTICYGRTNLLTYKDSATVVVRDIKENEMPGSSFRTKARGFYIVQKNDTSNFLCIFTRSLDGTVGLYLEFERNYTYREQMEQLQQILPIAETEFDFDSLGFVFISNLFYTGDLTIQISNEIYNSLGYYPKYISSEKANALLMKTKLVRDFNKQFQPYQNRISQVEVEHLDYLPLNIFLRDSGKIDTPRIKLPAKLLE